MTSKKQSFDRLLDKMHLTTISLFTHTQTVLRGVFPLRVDYLYTKSPPNLLMTYLKNLFLMHLRNKHTIIYQLESIR